MVLIDYENPIYEAIMTLQDPNTSHTTLIKTCDNSRKIRANWEHDQTESG